MMAAQADKMLIGKKSPYTNYFNPLQAYTMKLETNAHALKAKFPSQKLQKIKQLLEEFDNSVEMVAEMLEEEYGQPSMIVSEAPVTAKLNQHQQNRLLKNATTTLHKKLKKLQKQLQAAKESNEILKKQNECLKMHNHFLREREFRNNNEEFNQDIY